MQIGPRSVSRQEKTRETNPDPSHTQPTSRRAQSYALAESPENFARAGRHQSAFPTAPFPFPFPFPACSFGPESRRSSLNHAHVCARVTSEAHFASPPPAGASTPGPTRHAFAHPTTRKPPLSADPEACKKKKRTTPPQIGMRREACRGWGGFS